MALEEAAAWLSGDLILPIAGKKYAVPEFDAELGMRVEVILNAGAGKLSERSKQILDDEAERDLYRDVLGPAFDRMVADGVSWPRLKHAALTAMYHFNVSPTFAEAFWNGGPGEGKAVGTGSRPATRRRTAVASTTKSRASSSGTRSRRSS